MAILELFDVEQLSHLALLVRAVAWFWKAAKKFLRKKAVDTPKWEAISSSGVISVKD